MFQDKTIQKTYWAVVKNEPPKSSDKLIHFLQKNQKQNKSYVRKENASEAKRSELDYKTIAVSDHYFLLEVELY